MSKRIYPVDRLSYSSVKEYLGNPWRFYRIYIQKKATFTDGPATLVGKAFHKCLELYYSDPTFRTPDGLARAKEAGLEIIRAAAPQVDWGKTGSLEDAIVDALQTIDHYFAEDPGYENMGKLTCERILSGRVRGFPVNLKAVSDLTIEMENGEVGIVDFKKVSQLSNSPVIPDVELALGEVVTVPPEAPMPPGYLLQAWFNQKALYGATKLKANWMIFHEVKTSKNRKGGTQVCCRKVYFDTPEWKAVDEAMTYTVKMMLKDISRPKRVWLPNISDQLAGEDSWAEYLESLVQC